MKRILYVFICLMSLLCDRICLAENTEASLDKTLFFSGYAVSLPSNAVIGENMSEYEGSLYYEISDPSMIVDIGLFANIADEDQNRQINKYTLMILHFKCGSGTEYTTYNDVELDNGMIVNYHILSGPKNNGAWLRFESDESIYVMMMWSDSIDTQTFERIVRSIDIST